VTGKGKFFSGGSRSKEKGERRKVKGERRKVKGERLVLPVMPILAVLPVMKKSTEP